MKSKFTTGLISVLLAFTVSFAGIGCMVTAFEMTPVSLGKVALFCLLAAVLLTCLMGQGKKIVPILIAVAAALVFLWNDGIQTVLRSLSAILYKLTYIYSLAYGTPVLGSVGNNIDGVAPLEPGLCAIAVLVILGQTVALCRRKSGFWAVLPAILPLASCMVVTDIVPDNWAIFLLLAGIVLLLLTQTVRRRSEIDGNRLTAMLLIPVLLLNSLLLWAVPREGYEASRQELQQKLEDWFWNLPFFNEGPVGPGTQVGPGLPTVPVIPGPSVVEGLDVKLDTLGRNYQSQVTAMFVTAEKDGVLYLRGQAYDVYSDNRWQVRKDLEGEQLGWPATDLQTVQSINIRTRYVRKVQYFPYYVNRAGWQDAYENGKLPNDGMLLTYFYDQAEPTPGMLLPEENRLTDALYDHYLELPENTEEAAKGILSGIELNSGMTTAETAEAIAQFVSQTAAYDLMTDRMPADKEDFAIWFLEEAETGYCVHFATAATVLLRAAGVPSRYVTGYMLYAQSGQEVAVSEEQSHAWVEYYDPQLGWRLLEPTPADAQPQPPEITEPTEPPVTTEPPTTTEPPATTEPSKPTKPTEKPTQPTQPTEPGGNGGRPALDVTKLLEVLKWIGIAAGSVTVLWLQWHLRRKTRQRRMYGGKANAQALARWREVRRYCRILKDPPPESLKKLAEKAKFSQHTLTKEERAEFDAWLSDARARLKEKKGSFFLRLFWAV